MVQPALRPRVAELGLPPGAGYFNSGVLLFNLERMRQTAPDRLVFGTDWPHSARGWLFSVPGSRGQGDHRAISAGCD